MTIANKNKTIANKRTSKSDSGFSLMEMLMVITIIGTIAFMAVPTFIRYQSKARAAEAQSQLAALFLAESQFRAEWNGYSTDAIAIGFRPNGTLQYVIGFNTASVSPLPGYAGPALVPANFSTGVAGLCPAMGCINGATTPAGVAVTAVTLATTAAMTTFTAAAEGFVGGKQTDIWSIDQGKALKNPQPGGY